MGKPKGIPKNWPKSTEHQLSKLPYRVCVIGGEQRYKFKKNKIKTSKYEIYSFLPKLLLEEFNPKVKFANCYFLFVACLQIVPAISNTGGLPTTLIPLVIVILISGLMKGLEDYARHKADRKANSTNCNIYNPQTEQYEEKVWKDVKVGDFVLIKSRETVPADIVLVHTSEVDEAHPTGLCYIETKSLDGETNLKTRNSLPYFLNNVKNINDVGNLRGIIEMEHPNNLINEFTGNLQVPSSNGTEEVEKFPINPNNVILRGCVIRSTDYIVGFVVNTGHDVKIMQTKLSIKQKESKLQKVVSNKLSIVLFFLFFFCCFGAIGNIAFNNYVDIKDIYYLKWDDLKPGKQFVIQFFYILLLHSVFIPVSLYVTMALVRFGQSYFMMKDLDMYYPNNDEACLVRTMTLNEDIGQVTHVFSDKTGTLTCNVMNYRKASINGVSYGQGITEIGKLARKLNGLSISPEVLEAEEKAAKLAVPHVCFYCSNYEKDSDETKNPKQAKKIQQFYLFLALCHEVICEKIGSNTKLSAPNPDDEALVAAASYFGYTFVNRTDKFISVKNEKTGETLTFELLNLIPFTSARKKMSIIVRDTIKNEIIIITKGADSVLLSIASKKHLSIANKTKEHVQLFSDEGLRCLVLGYSIIEPAKYEVWSNDYNAALTDLNEIERKKRGEMNNIDVLENFIENDLTILGATAIEDRLQDHVSETITNLTNAGIKVWMITGDKQETAENIAVACNLVLPDEYMVKVSLNSTFSDTPEAIRLLLSKALYDYKTDTSSDLNKIKDELDTTDVAVSVNEFSTKFSLDDVKSLPINAKPRCLVVDGVTFLTIYNDPELVKLFVLFSQCCRSVTCCRFSPDQKRQVVDLIKKNIPDSCTLAIGDGANDVAMLTTAHIGVGIRGEEGVQAVNSSDYAIAQFSFLTPLLLKHGRMNYIRTSNLVLYMFYKNIFMSTTMFWFNFFNGFSGTKFYTEAAIQFYNLFYTSVPIILYSIYDYDLKPETVIKYAKLYKRTINSKNFNIIKFYKWAFDGFVDSLIIGFFGVPLLKNYSYESGLLESFSQLGATLFTAVVVIVNFKMFTFQNRFYLLNFIILILSIVAWIVIAIAASVIPFLDFNFNGIWLKLINSGTFWLVVILLSVTVLVKDLLVNHLKREVFYNSIEIIQEIEMNKKEEKNICFSRISCI